MEKIEYKGWQNCIRLANREIEVIATTDIGPRIMRAGFIGGQNFLMNVAAEMGLTGGTEWRFYGGHRLWHAPEISPRTYAPDNDAVDFEWDTTTLILKQKVEESTGIEKQIMIRVHNDTNVVEVKHRLINRNLWTIELAPWALSVMAVGGRAVYPQEEYRPHPEYFAPARPLVLWHYTDMSDSRWIWGKKYIQLRQSQSLSSKQKCGFLNKQGWAAYVLHDEVMIKRYAFEPGAIYPDYGCNTETFTNAEFLEIETLGPFAAIEPGAHVDHDEHWLFTKCVCSEQEDDIDEKILPLVRSM